MIFDVEVMAEDFRRVGYSEETIKQSVKRWEIYDGLKVKLIHDSNLGVIVGTEINVSIKWCRREADEMGKSNKVAIAQSGSDTSKKGK